MNILFVAQGDPRRTDFGSAQRAHFIWESLKRLGRVYTVYNIGEHDSNKVFDQENRIASVSFLSSSVIVRIVQILFGRFFPPASWPFRFRCSVMAKIPWSGVSFDICVAHFMGTAAQIGAWNIAPLYVDIDDLPSESFATIVRDRYPRPWGGGLQHVVNVWERFVLRKCRGSWIANGAQVGHIRKYCPCSALPNLAVMPSSTYKRNGCQKFQLMTVGLMSYEPNFWGVDWFLRVCWPQLHACFPELEYAIAGGGLPEEFRLKWKDIPKVRILGFVKDLDALYAESLAVVTPIRSGAGTCIKVMEAALHGRHVIATPFAVRGLDVSMLNALRILATEDPVSMVARINEITISKNREGIQDDLAACASGYNSFENFADQITRMIRA